MRGAGREEPREKGQATEMLVPGGCLLCGWRSCVVCPLVSAEPECGRGPQLPDSLCGTPIPAPAPLLCCMRLPLPIHLRQLWRPVLHCALSGHPPGNQVSLECAPGPHPFPPTPHILPGPLLILGFSACRCLKWTV